MRKKLSTAFTLIEMLIVIVIIGILAAALVPRLQSVQERTRDTKRKVDLQTISKGLSMFLIDNSMYPPAANATGTCSNPPDGGLCYVYNNNVTGGRWIIGLSGYLSSMPSDVKTNVIENNAGIYTYGPWANGYFVYAYGNVARTAVNGVNHFDLYAQLENRRDPERNEIVHYTYSYTYQPLYPAYSNQMYAIKP